MDPLDAAAVEGEAEGDSEHPYAVETHDRLGSTNDRARELAREGRRDVAVLAAEQTAGRGRRDRSWAGPSGGLYCSVVLDLDLSPAAYPLVTLAAGVAVVRALADLGVEARLKWPNDVLADGKLAGLLTERVDDAVVVGIGVNVDPSGDLPDGADSVAEHREVPAGARERLARETLTHLADLLADPDAVLPAWREHADTLGQRVRVETPDGTVTGEAIGVEHPGALVVATEAGEVRVDAGDCEHLRPA